MGPRAFERSDLTSAAVNALTSLAEHHFTYQWKDNHFFFVLAARDVHIR